MFVKPKHFRFVDPEISFTVRDVGDAFCITLRSQAYARYVYLDFDAFDGLFDDNYFDMSKGEKEIRLLKETLSRPVTAREVEEKLQVMTVADLF